MLLLRLFLYEKDAVQSTQTQVKNEIVKLKRGYALETVPVQPVEETQSFELLSRGARKSRGEYGQASKNLLSIENKTMLKSMKDIKVKFFIVVVVTVVFSFNSNPYILSNEGATMEVAASQSRNYSDTQMVSFIKQSNDLLMTLFLLMFHLLHQRVPEGERTEALKRVMPRELSRNKSSRRSLR